MAAIAENPQESRKELFLHQFIPIAFIFLSKLKNKFAMVNADTT